MGKVKYTTETFIEKANKVHNNFYNYSKTVYTKTANKVIIICPIHGEFEQEANSHINAKCGCIKCYLDKVAEKATIKNKVSKVRKVKKVKSKNTNITNKKYTLKDFIFKANNVHNFAYDYSKVKYINIRTPIEITCREHGSFWQIPNGHLKGQGCRYCSRTQPWGWSKSKWINIQRNRLSKLYVIKFKNELGEFIKIGITHESVERRLIRQLYYMKKYKNITEIIKVINSDNAELIYNMETKTKKDLKQFRFKVIESFPGSTECYNITPEVLSYINKI